MEKAILKINATPYLLGENPTGWTASLEVMLNMSHKDAFDKIIHGAYDYKEPSHAS